MSDPSGDFAAVEGAEAAASPDRPPRTPTFGTSPVSFGVNTHEFVTPAAGNEQFALQAPAISTAELLVGQLSPGPTSPLSFPSAASLAKFRSGMGSGLGLGAKLRFVEARTASALSVIGRRSATGERLDQKEVRRYPTEATRIVERCSLFSDPLELRASRLADVMHFGGKLFENSAGCATTYDLSVPVHQIDSFISHNWATGRQAKFLTLALYFNLPIALFFTALALVIAVILTVDGRLPVVRDPFGGLSGVACQALAVPIFLVVVCVGHEPLTLCGVRRVLPDVLEPRLFLDKTCIHQTNEEVKRKGIQKLGAFLYHSSRMVIVYTDVYLQRLWTVYELASFLSFHSADEMTLLPTSLTWLTIQVMLWIYATDIAWIFIVPLIVSGGEVSRMWFSLSLVPTSLVLVPLLRKWAQEKDEIKTRMVEFSIERAQVFNEADREVVQGNIVAFMQKSGRVSRRRAPENALEAFNDVVRRRLPRVLTESTGRVGLPYRRVLLFSFFGVVPAALDWVGGQARGERPTTRAASLFVLHEVGLMVAGLPLTVACALSLTTRALHVRSSIAVALAAASAATATVNACLCAAGNHLREGSETSDLLFLLFCSYELTLVVLTLIIYFRAPAKDKEHNGVCLTPSGVAVKISETSADDIPPPASWLDPNADLPLARLSSSEAMEAILSIRSERVEQMSSGFSGPGRCASSPPRVSSPRHSPDTADQRGALNSVWRDALYQEICVFGEHADARELSAGQVKKVESDSVVCVSGKDTVATVSEHRSSLSFAGNSFQRVSEKKCSRMSLPPVVEHADVADDAFGIQVATQRERRQPGSLLAMLEQPLEVSTAQCLSRYLGTPVTESPVPSEKALAYHVPASISLKPAAAQFGEGSARLMYDYDVLDEHSDIGNVEHVINEEPVLIEVSDEYRPYCCAARVSCL